jgi:hypothetical protein
MTKATQVTEIGGVPRIGLRSYLLFDKEGSGQNG